MKGGEFLKTFKIREVETVKTTAALYECRACFPDWFCDWIEGTS